jgi:predicted GIY-YIG superfamily endonuclease
MTEHYCYILYNLKNNKTYNGYTVNIERRLRQHNCEIKGGARYTTRAQKCDGIEWKYLAIISGSPTQKIALSLEWHIKYPTNKRPRPREYQGPQGRLEGLKLALANPKFQDYNFNVEIPDASWASLYSGVS